MEKSCEEIRELLVDYADGQLLPSDSKKVAEHLAECAHCRRMLDALQRSLEFAEIIWEDGLGAAKEIRIPIPGKAPKIHWPRYAAVAAGILLVVTTSIVWRGLVKSTQKELTFAEIERKITESASAARLLAAAELLADYSNNEAIVKEQFRYIVETYPETAAATEAKSKIQ